MAERLLEDRFWEKVDKRGADECWPWMAALAAGYGRIYGGAALGGPTIWPAHRVAYVLAHGPIPANLELDHLCHTADTSCVTGRTCPHRRCVNPAHLEPVTKLENALRRESRVLTCRQGHDRSAENRGSNGRSGLKCRVCHRLKMQNLRAAGTYAFPLEGAA